MEGELARNWSGSMSSWPAASKPGSAWACGHQPSRATLETGRSGGGEGPASAAPAVEVIARIKGPHAVATASWRSDEYRKRIPPIEGREEPPALRKDLPRARGPDALRPSRPSANCRPGQSTGPLTRSRTTRRFELLLSSYLWSTASGPRGPVAANVGDSDVSARRPGFGQRRYGPGVMGRPWFLLRRRGTLPGHPLAPPYASLRPMRIRSSRSSSRQRSPHLS